MTALVGIKAYGGTKKIILASDTQITYVDEKDIPTRKVTGFSKIASGSYWAMGFSGDVSPQLKTFYRALKSDAKNESAIEKAVQKKMFEEVNNLNTLLCKEFGNQAIVEFLLATSRPCLGLYMVDVMGNVLERPVDDPDKDNEYLVLGSGGESLKSFIDEKMGSKAIDQEGITCAAAISLAYEAIDATTDVESGGHIELFVIGEDGVQNIGQRLRKAAKKAIATELESIVKEVGQPPSQPNKQI